MKKEKIKLNLVSRLSLVSLCITTSFKAPMKTEMSGLAFPRFNHFRRRIPPHPAPDEIRSYPTTESFFENITTCSSSS